MEVYAELDNVGKKEKNPTPYKGPKQNKVTSTIENTLHNMSEFDQTIVGTVHPRAQSSPNKKITTLSQIGPMLAP